MIMNVFLGSLVYSLIWLIFFLVTDYKYEPTPKKHIYCLLCAFWPITVIIMISFALLIIINETSGQVLDKLFGVKKS